MHAPIADAGLPRISPTHVLPDAAFAVFVTDAAGRITAWSPSAAGATGFIAAEVVGRHLAILYPAAARDEGHPHEALGRAARAGRAEAQVWLEQKDGARIRAAVTLTALRDQGGLLAGFVCQVRDLSEQLAAEARRLENASQLAAVAAIRQDAATYGTELTAFLPRLALRAREFTGADACILELREGSGAAAHAHDGDAHFDLPLNTVLVPQGGATAGARLRCLRYDDRHESPEVVGDVCDRAGIGALLAIPILHERKTIGWLSVVTRSGRGLDEQHAGTLELMATLIGGPIAHAQASEVRRTLASERARAQTAQRESEVRVRAALDASLDALFILRAVRTEGTITDFTLLDVNLRAVELCGIQIHELRGQLLSRVASAARRLTSIAALADVVDSRTPLEQERETIEADGAARWIQEQIVPLEDGVTVTVRDVTARVQAEAQVRRAREIAETANRAKTDFVAKMSHELRTPLNSVIGFANILKRNKRNALDEADLAYVGRISHAGTHLLALINDVLDIAKVEAGHTTLELSLVNVVGLAQSVVTQLEATAHTAGLTLSMSATHDALTLDADPGKLRQVLYNIIGNAIKFTPAGDVRVHVVGESRPDGLAPVPRRIEVTDTGIGIPADRLTAVFDAFEQAESSTSRRYGGTGLGLSISRALCEAMGFSLSASSELGVGTTFVVEV